jgi:tripartite-type tricarboxylate transporter receptor subunit TctC
MKKSLGSRWLAKIVLVCACILAATAPSQAQDWPTHPIRIIVGFGRGSGTDIVARIVASALSENLGQPVLVDNRPSPGGTLAANEVAKSAADGYTALMMNSGHTISAVMYASLPYDSVRDFQPVMLVAASSLVIVTNPSLGVSDLPGLIALAKQQPGALKFGSIGLGSAQHFAGELLRQSAGIDVTHVAYKDTAEAVAALHSGQVQFLPEMVQAVLPQIRSGDLKALAVTAPVRWPTLADVRTVGEQGFEGYDVTGWHGLAYPAGTPRPIVDKTAKALSAVLRREAVRKAIAEAGAMLQPTTTEEFGQFIEADIAKWRRVRDRAGIHAQVQSGL